MFRAIWTADTDFFSPAILVGYEVERQNIEKLKNLPSLPDWYSVISQHRGGTGVCKPFVAGIMLRLASNHEKAGSTSIELVNLFRQLGSVDISS